MKQPIPPYVPGETFNERFHIPALKYIPIEETKFNYKNSKKKKFKSNHSVNASTSCNDVCHGGFYAKMVNTVNHLRQYNHMVYGSPEGETLTKVCLQGLPTQ